MSSWLDTIAQDARFAIRIARSSPVVTAIIVLTIALGIGANTAIFSIIDAVLLRPLPYPHDEQLVSLWATNPDKSIPRFGVSYADFLDWRARTRSYQDMALFSSTLTSLNGSDGPESVGALQVSPNFLSVLGLRPEIGRFFGPEDERGEASNAVILGNAYWRRRFGSSASVLNKQLSINGRLRTVIGVLPREANLLGPALTNAPLDIVTVMELSTYPKIERHAQHLFGALARLKPTVTVQEANAELYATEVTMAVEFPEIAGWSASVFRFRDDLSQGSRQPLLLLLAAAALLLLIACINVANLLVVRGTTRRAEIAVRQAMGATRTRLIQQVVVESVTLGLVGGAMGIGAAAASLGAIRRLVPAGSLTRVDDIRLQPAVLAFALVTSVLSAVIFGLWPALTATRSAIGTALRDGTRGNTAGASRGRRVLVVVELSLALVLTVCATLVVQSVRQMLRTNPGFSTEHTVTSQITLGNNYPDSSGLVFYRSLLADLEARPTIEAAGATDTPPLVNAGIFSSIRLVGVPPRPANDPLMCTIRLITPGFFRAMGMHFVAGQDISWSEPNPSIILSETAAHEFWRRTNAVGEQIAFNIEKDGHLVVGVVNDARQQSLATPSGPVLYVSMRRGLRLFRTMTLVVRGKGDVASTVAAMREAVDALDPGLPLYNVQTLDEIVEQSVAQPHLESILLTVFAIGSLLLASLGIYGAISYSVAQRRQEIGVRLALGAQAPAVLRMVLSEGALLGFIGIAAGSLGALAASRLVRAWLVGIGPVDIQLMITAGAGVLLLTMIASAVPAARAASVDPLIAMRRD